MQASDPILEETLQCLVAHLHPEWGDCEPIDVFNRLLAKNVRPAAWTKNSHMDITFDQIHSRQERWSVAELAGLARGHAGVAGAYTRLDGPIVVVEYLGAMRLLDGNHRINTWLATGDAGLHPVHIHAVEGAGQLVERPPAR